MGRNSDDGELSGIAESCRSDGGLAEVTLGDLREELGYHKLGRWVLAEIEEALGRARLGYFPHSRLDPEQNREPRQQQTVWIYDKEDGVRGRVIDAILEPDKHDVRSALSSIGVDRPTAMSAEEKLHRIRELVCE